MSALLEVCNVSRSFGPLRAVREVSFSVREGELLGLIGPNGAGKSTLYNLLAGMLKPNSGQLIFEGRNIAGWRPYEVARAGIARTFQIPKPFRQMTVLENVIISALLRDRVVAAARRTAEAILTEVGLIRYADSPIGVLTAGLLKRLEVARALALRPRLVLFDEIMAGLTPAEVKVMTDMVAGLPARGVTVIWVEHVLYAIMNAAHRILVLNRGELIADGTPQQVAKDPATIKAYLGEEMRLA
jgi:branched-chain amino acid transport system ATP-binding protein